MARSGRDLASDNTIPRQHLDGTSIDAFADYLRLYEPDEPVDKDGYPLPWRRIDGHDFGVKDLVRAAAGHRCVRCGHPYRKGEHGNGEWSACDAACGHGGEYRWWSQRDQDWRLGGLPVPQAIRLHVLNGTPVESRWRILTVHHLNGDKRDLRWHNIVALDQRCHLQIQGRVILERAYIFEHSDWFKPYAAAWYSLKYLNEEITREEAIARQDELLGFERLA